MGLYRMKFIYLAALMFFALKAIANDIIATFDNNGTVTKQELIDEFKIINKIPDNENITYESIPDRMKEMLTKNIALTKIVALEAEKSGFTETPEMKAEFDYLKRNITYNHFLDLVARENLKNSNNTDRTITKLKDQYLRQIAESNNLKLELNDLR